MAMNPAAKFLHQFRHSFHPLILVMFLSADIVFVLLHISYKKLPVTDYHVLLDTDKGYPEVFQYLKYFWAAGALLVVCHRTREWIHGGWALLMVYFLFDDCMSLHEEIGISLTKDWSITPPFELRLQDLGEMMVSFSVGIPWFILMCLCYRRASAHARSVTMDLLVLLGLLAFFGVFFDMASMAIVPDGDFRGHAVMEDGGEMFAMTLIASYAVHLLDPDRHEAGKIWLWVRSLAEWCLARVLPKRG